MNKCPQGLLGVGLGRLDYPQSSKFREMNPTPEESMSHQDPSEQPQQTKGGI